MVAEKTFTDREDGSLPQITPNMIKNINLEFKKHLENINTHIETEQFLNIIQGIQFSSINVCKVIPLSRL